MPSKHCDGPITGPERLLGDLAAGEAIRCRNVDRDILWYFTAENGQIWRAHEDHEFDPRIVSRSMALLSIGADPVETDVVSAEEIDHPSVCHYVQGIDSL